MFHPPDCPQRFYLLFLGGFFFVKMVCIFAFLSLVLSYTIGKREVVLKKLLLTGCILLLAAASGFSSDLAKIPLVDIPESEKEIADSQAQIEELKTAIQQLEAENQQLVEEVKVLEKQMVDMAPLMASIRDKGAELLGVSKKITDANAAEQTRLAILKNDDLLRRMSETKSESKRAVYLKNRQVTFNKRKIVDSEAVIEKLTDRITFLQAAVIKSKALKQELDAYMVDMDTYLKEAEGYLQEIKDPKSVGNTPPATTP